VIGAMAASDNAVNISVSFFIRFFSVDGCKSLSRRVFSVASGGSASNARSVYKAENIRCAFN
ncbi:hypothetical protein SB780_37075, partial [Burkholderia sp. SIMBA_057]